MKLFKKHKNEDQFLQQRQAARVADKYKNLRKQRSQSRLSIIRHNFNRNFQININKRKIGRIVLVFSTIFIIIGGIYGALNLEIFNIQNIEVTANDEYNKDLFNGFKGENIFKLRDTQIENYAKSNVPDLSNVYVLKYLPNTIKIYLELHVPKYVLINYDSYKTLDKDFFVIKSYTEGDFNLAPYERDIILGLGDSNADYVKEIYQAGLKDEEKKDFDWTKVPEDKKQEILNNISSEITNRITSNFVQIEQKVDERLQDLPKIYFDNFTEELTEEEIVQKLTFSDDINSFLNANGFKSARIEWYNNFFVRIFTEDSKTFIFSIKRDINDQKRDFGIAKIQGLFQNGSTFDFRTVNFSVKD